MFSRLTLALFATATVPLVQAHVAMFHPSMWGLNVTGSTTQTLYGYDNRPVVPLMNMDFKHWWFHNHLDHPPAEGQFFELPAGGSNTAELACTKDATSFFDVGQDDGGDIRGQDGASLDDPCPGSDRSLWHTSGLNDSTGCALAITYQSDVNAVQPEDFTVFSVNHTCVFHRFTEFQVPERMPACPPGGCICAWFWIHSPDSGGEQNFMNGFRCNVTGAAHTVPLAQPEIPRRCGHDVVNGSFTQNPPEANHDLVPGNCTYGAKQPFYWFNTERNNMFEGAHAPPFYNGLYNFDDGAQNDIFVDSYDFPLPAPSENQTIVPSFLYNGGGKRSQKIARGSDFASSAGGSNGQSNGGSASGNGSSSGGESASSATGSAVASGTSTGVGISTASTAAESTTFINTSTTAHAQTTSTVIKVSTSTSIQRSTVTSTRVVTATATVQPATVTVVVSVSPASSPNTPSSATTTVIAFGSTTETLSSIQSLVPIAAALAEPLGNDASLRLSELALDGSSLSPNSNSQLPPLAPQACKRGLDDPSTLAKTQQKSRALFSYHATKSFNRRKLTDKRQLWNMW